MRKIFFIAISAIAIFSTQIFSFERAPIRLEGTFMGGAPTGFTSGFGVGYGIGGQYEVMDNLYVGGKYGVFAMASVSVNLNEGEQGADVAAGAVRQFLLKANYHLTKSAIRPFAGIGVGIYNVALESVSGGVGGAGIAAEVGNKLGFEPELGLLLGKFKISGVYNLIFGKSSVEVKVGNPKELSANFWALDIGLSWEF